MTIVRDDLVRIVRQPSNQKDINLVGQVCLVDIVKSDEDLLFLSAIDKNGIITGNGAVPTDCVEIVTDESWLRAAELCKKHSENSSLSGILGSPMLSPSNPLVQELLEKVLSRPKQSARELGVSSTVEDLAERFDLTGEDIMEIFYTIDTAIIQQLKGDSGQPHIIN